MWTSIQQGAEKVMSRSCLVNRKSSTISIPSGAPFLMHANMSCANVSLRKNFSDLAKFNFPYHPASDALIVSDSFGQVLLLHET